MERTKFLMTAVAGLAIAVLLVGSSRAQIAEGESDGSATAPTLQVLSIEKIATNFQLVEGPVWHHSRQLPGALAQTPVSLVGDFLFFSDILANITYKWSEQFGVEVFRTDTSSGNGETLDLQGRLITCEGFPRRRVVRINSDGTVVSLADHYLGKRLNAPNDVVVKSDGTMYFTDPPYSTPTPDLELNFFGVYHLDPKTGILNPVVKDFVRPNGIASSPDESKLYIDDSCSPGDRTPTGDKECVTSGSQGLIKVYDVHPDGSLSGGQVFAHEIDPTTAGVPDGMKLDSRGNVYSTGPGGVWVFSPKGHLLGRITMPEVSSNVGWGPANWPMLLAEDGDLQTLYVCAQTGLYRVRLKVPRCGRC